MLPRILLVILAALALVTLGPMGSSVFALNQPISGPAHLRWVDSDVILHAQDTMSDRQYALDALALKFVRQYTNDPIAIERIQAPYWCGTPVLAQLPKLRAEEISEAALRRRAQSLVAREKRDRRAVTVADQR